MNVVINRVTAENAKYRKTVAIGRPDSLREVLFQRFQMVDLETRVEQV